MSTDLNNLKLKELIYLAKHVTYIKPDKKYEDFSENEILFEAINYALNSQAQIDSLLNVCKNLPPVKLLAKDKIKKYLTHYMK